MNLDIKAIAHHRNGVGGIGFSVVLFDHDEEPGRKLGIVFDLPDAEATGMPTEDGYCAVLDVVKLAAGNIRFGENSYRGDRYEPGLRRAIDEATNTRRACIDHADHRTDL